MSGITIELVVPGLARGTAENIAQTAVMVAREAMVVWRWLVRASDASPEGSSILEAASEAGTSDTLACCGSRNERNGAKMDEQIEIRCSSASNKNGDEIRTTSAEAMSSWVPTRVAI